MQAECFSAVTADRPSLYKPGSWVAESIRKRQAPCVEEFREAAAVRDVAAGAASSSS
jgi:hypothetical protein